MRRFFLLLLLCALAGCPKDDRDESAYLCTLFVVSEEFGVERPYVFCEDQFGDRLAIWWDEFSIATPEELSSWTWVNAHRLPLEWFDEFGAPLPETPPTLPPED